MYFIGPENNKMIIILAFVHLANKTRVLEASVKSGAGKRTEGWTSCCGEITETLLSGNTTEVETLKRLHP